MKILIAVLSLSIFSTAVAQPPPVVPGNSPAARAIRELQARVLALEAQLNALTDNQSGVLGPISR